MDEYIENCPVPHGTSESIIKFPSNKYIVNQTIVCIVNVILIICAVILNCASILTISRCSQLKGKVCYLLILIQSLVDLLIALGTAPLYILIQASDIAGTANCVVNFYVKLVAVMPLCLSAATLCALSFERYLAVIYPLFHRTRKAKRFLLVCVGCHCAVIIILFPFLLFYNAVYYVLITGNMSLSLAFHAFIYIRIFLALRRRFRQEIRPVGKEPNVSSPARTRCCSKEMKLAKSCFCVLLAFIFCSLPGVVVSGFSAHLGVLVFRVLQSWSVTFGLLNSSLNSIIFFWSRPVFKREAMKILKGIQNGISLN